MEAKLPGTARLYQSLASQWLSIENFICLKLEAESWVEISCK